MSVATSIVAVIGHPSCSLKALRIQTIRGLAL
jgi:hypothetical protein